MNGPSIAVVMTFHNRRAKTLSALQALFASAHGLRVSVFAVDDGSTDGTAEAIAKLHPHVEVLRADGSLFWNGGMRVAFAQALLRRHDFYLWLNDDMRLFPDCLQRLLATHSLLRSRYARDGIVVGSARDRHGKTTYGGQVRAGFKALDFVRVEPGSEPRPCQTFNGNCVLISAAAAEQLGNLDQRFSHAMGDMDYGLRASASAVPILVMPGHAGECDHDHSVAGTYLDHELSLRQRWKKVVSPKGLPLRAWATFCRRHAGPLWFVYWGWPYARIALSTVTARARFKMPTLLIVSCVAGLLIAAGVMASGRPLVANAPVPAEFFGIHMHRADAGTPWPTVRFGAWRLWDAGIDWRAIEPVKGQWRFEKLDRLVGMAESNDIDPVFVFGVTPAWASARPTEPFVYGAGGAAEARELKDWEDFVYAIAMRYRGRIRHFELWNEPKFADSEPVHGAFFTGTLASLVKQACSAYRILKQVDPANRLLTPGFTGSGERLDRFLSAGGRQCSDIVAFHFYSPTPERMLQRIGEVRAIMEKHGIGEWPLWNTEQGYEIVGPHAQIPGRLGFEVADMQTQANYIPRAHALAAAAGVDRFFFYSWERLLDSDLRPSIGAAALNATVRWLRNSTVRCTQSAALWTCALTRSGRNAWLVWRTDGVRQWQPPADWKVNAFELPYGTGGKIQSSVIEIGQTPILLKREPLAWVP